MSDGLIPEIDVVRSEGGGELTWIEYVRFDVVNAGHLMVAYIALRPGDNAPWTVYTEWPDVEGTPDYVVNARDLDRSSAIDWAQDLALGFLGDVMEARNGRD